MKKTQNAACIHPNPHFFSQRCRRIVSSPASFPGARRGPPPGVPAAGRDGPAALRRLLRLLGRETLPNGMKIDPWKRRSALIFPSLLRCHSRTGSLGTGVRDLKTYICSARQNWIPLLSSAFRCGHKFCTWEALLTEQVSAGGY